MRYISLFSGIEAASVAWEPLGWEPVCFCEVDEFPSTVLAYRFPNVPNLGDVTEIDWSEVNERFGAVDVLVGGSPCQSFSIAGNREGLKGESGLMFEYIRAIRELLQASGGTGPRYIVWENVPGALSSERGVAFGQLLAELDELGYGLAWRVLDAQFVRVSNGSNDGFIGPVAQRRRRVFLIGVLGSPHAAEILFERESMRWDHPKGREAREALAGDATERAGIGDCENVVGSLCARDWKGIGYQDADKVIFQKTYMLKLRHTGSENVGGGQGAMIGEDVSYTLATGQDQTMFVEDGSTYIVRRLTPREYERLQGFPDDWTLIPYRGKPAEECPDAPRYKAMGNSMAVPVMLWLGKRINAFDVLHYDEVGL